MKELVGRIRALVTSIGDGLAVAVSILVIYHSVMILLLFLGGLLLPRNILPQWFVGLLGVIFAGACFLLEMSLGRLRSIVGSSFRDRSIATIVAGLVLVVEGVLYYIYLAGFKGLGCSLSILGTVVTVLGAFATRID